MSAKLSETLDADIRHRFWDLMSRPEQQSTEKTEIDLQMLLSSLNRSFSKTLKACWLARRLKTDFLWCSSEHGRSRSYRLYILLWAHVGFLYSLYSGIIRRDATCTARLSLPGALQPAFSEATKKFSSGFWSPESEVFGCKDLQKPIFWTSVLVTSLASEILAFQGGPWKTAHMLLNSQRGCAFVNPCSNKWGLAAYHFSPEALAYHSSMIHQVRRGSSRWGPKGLKDSADKYDFCGHTWEQSQQSNQNNVIFWAGCPQLSKEHLPGKLHRGQVSIRNQPEQDCTNGCVCL